MRRPTTGTRLSSRQCPDVLFDRPAAFAGRVLLDLQRRVIAALPMQDHFDPVILDAHDDLMQDGPDNSLARRRRRGGVRPSDLEISAKAHETFALPLVEDRLRLLIEGFQLIFEPTDLDELFIPSTFKFARDKTVVRIHRIILPPCARRLKALLLQRQFDLPALFHGLRPSLFDCRKRRLDAEWLHKPDDLGSHSRVHAQAAEGDAAVSSMIDEASLAMIAADIPGRAAIGDMQLAAAMTAAQETRQKSLAAADRAARHETFAVGVVGDQQLIPLELGPR